MKQKARCSGCPTKMNNVFIEDKLNKFHWRQIPKVHFQIQLLSMKKLTINLGKTVLNGLVQYAVYTEGKHHL